MSSVLITGATRGLGLELVNQFLKLPSSTVATVFITGRASQPPAPAQELISASKGRAQYTVLDVTSDTSVAQAVRDVDSRLGQHGLDIIINNAAVMYHEGQPSQVTTKGLEELFALNVSSVQRVMAAFLPLLEKGQQKKIVNITSTLGSVALIKNFAMADSQSYKITKAALNMLTSLWALELGPKGFTVFPISPGWLKTDLGGPYADLDVSQGASQVVQIVMEATPDKDNGAFRDVFIEGHPTYSGTNAPW